MIIALVHEGALAMSSSAFVLQLLGERGERQSKTGLATFGILLLQDVAVVPLLVILPLMQNFRFVFNPSKDIESYL